MLFLLCFQPIIAFADRLSTLGFQMMLTIPDSSGLPPTDAHIYINWQEEESDEPPGWYLCQVSGYLPNGKSTTRYRNGSTEEIDLRSIEWSFARKSSKPYLPLEAKLPHAFPLKKVREASMPPKGVPLLPRSILGFADDTTLLSNSPSDHQLALSNINKKCSDLGLEIRPDKLMCFLRF